MRLSTSLFGAMVLATASGSAAAQSPVPAVRHFNALDACRSVAADAARLACLDREVAALLAASRSGELSVVDRADMRAARRSLFGFALPKLPFFAGDKSADEVPDVLDTTVVAVQDIANGRYRIRIAAGDAVWETTEASIRLRTPRSGDKIMIRKAALGSYFLRLQDQVAVKGRRVK